MVSQGLAPESLLDSYEKERHAVGEDVVASAKKMAREPVERFSSGKTAMSAGAAIGRR